LLGAYLRQNELGVLSGEQIQEGGHKPSELNQRCQLYRRACSTLYLCRRLPFIFSYNYERKL
jgi:hypothetical protein